MTKYYEHEGVTIYHSDCLPVLAALPAESIDLIFTSPPYNLGNTSGGGMPDKARMGHYSSTAPLGKRGGAGRGQLPRPAPSKAAIGKWSGGDLANGYSVHTDALSHAEYVAWQQDVLRACWRVLGPTGAIFYNHKVRILDGQAIFPLDYVPPELRPYVRQEIIWARAGGINFSPAFYLPTHERIVVLARPAWRLKSKGASGMGDVWYVPQEEYPEHPAPFPLALPARAIESTGAQTILDPFMGRGTTLRAARLLGCARAIGIDNAATYCRLAVGYVGLPAVETDFGPLFRMEIPA